jgi:AraC-like DNA-binding protein
MLLQDFISSETNSLYLIKYKDLLCDCRQLLCLIDQLNELSKLRTSPENPVEKPLMSNELQLILAKLIQNETKLMDYDSKTERISTDFPKTSSLDKIFLDKLIKLIEDNLVDSCLSIEKLSKTIGYSHSQLYRKTKALTNLSPNEFIRYIRLKRAAFLLKNKAGNISEICYSVGFTKPSYFTECFKNFYGCTPSEYSTKK